jgi:hypothetical protein
MTGSGTTAALAVHVAEPFWPSAHERFCLRVRGLCGSAVVRPTWMKVLIVKNFAVRCDKVLSSFKSYGFPCKLGVWE